MLTWKGLKLPPNNHLQNWVHLWKTINKPAIYQLHKGTSKNKNSDKLQALQALQLRIRLLFFVQAWKQFMSTNVYNLRLPERPNKCSVLTFQNPIKSENYGNFFPEWKQVLWLFDSRVYNVTWALLQRKKCINAWIAV